MRQPVRDLLTGVREPDVALDVALVAGRVAAAQGP